MAQKSKGSKKPKGLSKRKREKTSCSPAKERVNMGICPVCAKDIGVAEKDVYSFSKVCCSQCGSLLEVINEDPLRLERVLKEGGWIAEWFGGDTEPRRRIAAQNVNKKTLSGDKNA